MGRTGSAFITVLVAIFIVLVCLLYLAIVTTGSGSGEWQLQVSGPVDYLSVGQGNVLYAFSGNNVTAISPGGQVKWTFCIPDRANGSGGYGTLSHVYAEDQGNLYLYAGNNTQFNDGINGVQITTRDILAVYSSGELMWDYRTVDRSTFWNNDPSIAARDGRVYEFHNYTETVLDSKGQVLFNISNIYGPAAVDEAGNLYVVPMGNNTASYWKFDNYSGSTSDLLPSRAIDAYGPDGTLLWHKELEDYIHASYRLNMPLYRDGMLYFLAGDRIIILDHSGNELWSYDFDTEDIRLNGDMPSDAAGNLYVDAGSERNYWFPYTYAVNVDNRSVSTVKIPSSQSSYAYLGHVHLYNNVIDGICYLTNTTDVIRIQPLGWPSDPENFVPGLKELEDINEITVTATDIATGGMLWSFKVPTDDARTDVINESNVGMIFVSRALEDLNARNQSLRDIWYSMYVDRNSTPINSVSTVNIIPGHNITYIVVNDVNFEPIAFNQSRCRYINGIYALNETGQLLWYRPADARIEQFADGNGTIYYSTGGGKIFASSTGIVSGVAVLATLYVFLRFLAIGAVSRARSRLDGNENRNRVYRYIAENPGLTLYDISRDLGMNVGTVRYHLMILGLNHRIVVCKAFGKFARYFKNSGTHSPDDQLLYSALRRQGIRSILGLLVERPGLSNREIAGMLQMRESAASRYMKELTSTGLVERRHKAEGRYAYYINEQYGEALALTIKADTGKTL